MFLYDSGCDIVYRDDQCMHIYLQELLLKVFGYLKLMYGNPWKAVGMKYMERKLSLYDLFLHHF